MPDGWQGDGNSLITGDSEIAALGKDGASSASIGSSTSIRGSGGCARRQGPKDGLPLSVFIGGHAWSADAGDGKQQTEYYNMSSGGPSPCGSDELSWSQHSLSPQAPNFSLHSWCSETVSSSPTSKHPAKPSSRFTTHVSPIVHAEADVQQRNGGGISFAPVSPTQLRMVQAVLASPNEVKRHAEHWFTLFRSSGTRSSAGREALNFQDLEHLLQTLQSEIGVPAPGKKILTLLLDRFGVDGGSALLREGFTQLFFRILLRCRCRYGRLPIRCQLFENVRCELLRDTYVSADIEVEAGAMPSFLNLHGASIPSWSNSDIQPLAGNFGRVSHVNEHNSPSGAHRTLRAVGKSNIVICPHNFANHVGKVQALVHPHIVRLLDCDEDYWNVYFLSEADDCLQLPSLIAEGSAASWPLTEAWTQALTCQILEALAHCHQHEIIHGNLTALNILLRRGPDPFDVGQTPRALLADSGLCHLFRLSSHHRSDMVGLGAVLHLLLSGGEVWSSAGAHALCSNFRRSPVACDDRPSPTIAAAAATVAASGAAALSACSGEATNLLSRLLTSSHESLTAAEALRHLWFQNITLHQDHGEHVTFPPELADPTRAAAAAARTEAVARLERRRRYDVQVVQRVASLMRLDSTLQQSVWSRQNHAVGEVLGEAETCTELERLGVGKTEALRLVQMVGASGRGVEVAEASVGRIDFAAFLETCIAEFTCRIDKSLWDRFRGRVRGGFADGAVDAQEAARELLGVGLEDVGLSPGSASIRDALHKLDPGGVGTILFDELRASFAL
eukprot:TRINITY_DN48157_c0_g1_i1.p1 TRINITY_DN48157_c0_g1~~TRINITY_DN48157_c0_g1_i1.p1  ORF type:complete len:844 (-),score=103.26 TRINITY_DN48157_c0_g1_i1:44-2410(-)